VGGSVLIQATATDASGVDAVEFYVDGEIRCTDTILPYTCSWNTDLYGNGAHTLTTMAYDSWDNVGVSTSVGVTVYNAPAPSDIVVNGGFENGAGPWAYSGAASRGNGWKSANSGSAYAQLGGNNATGSVSQEVTIPSTAQGQYRFWYGVDTQEKGKSLGDYLFVEVDSGTPRPTTLVTLNNRDRAKKYKEAVFDLSKFRGQTVTLIFRVATDGSNPTTFYIDDVSLK
jgi:hypothetical protein